MTYSEEYEFCIGRVGLSKAEYFSLTPAETYTKVFGYIFNNERQASYIRNLFHLQFNQWSKQKVSAEKLWPLPEIDTIEELDEEEMYERNKRLIDAFQKMQRQMK
jgi:hypothetical protein